jgi:hypothetical protein
MRRTGQLVIEWVREEEKDTDTGELTDIRGCSPPVICFEDHEAAQRWKPVKLAQ